MKNTLFPGNSVSSKDWLSGELLKVEPDQQDRFLRRWYKWTAVPEPPTSASFLKRETARRIRLFSTVAFFFMLLLVLILPACLVTTNHLDLYLDSVLIGMTGVALIINRNGKPLIAGTILVLIAELVLIGVILTTTPFDGINLALYDLFVVVELLAVSLIQPQWVFVLALFDSLFIGLDLMYQPHTPYLAQALTTQYLPTASDPIVLQLIVAGVAFLWVRNSTRAIIRADRAEMVAKLEHTIAEERLSSELARKQLEESIEQLVTAHTEAINSRQMVAKVSYPPEAKILWPLIGVINSLWVRLQRAHQTEYELHQLKQAITMYVELLHRAQLTPQQPIPMYQTKTNLDSLMLAVRNLQNTRSQR